MAVDYTKATKVRDPDGNIVPCKFTGRGDAKCFWVKCLGPCYQNGHLESGSENQMLLFRNDGKHNYGRKYTLILDKEENNDMKKATFTSTDPVRKPTHWRNRDTGFVMWKTPEGWNRITVGGTVDDRARISVSPDNRPEEFDALYGTLSITISPEG